MIGLHTLANTWMAGTTARAICSLRCMAIRFGTSSEMTIEQYEMISVNAMVVRGAATLCGTPQSSMTGTIYGAIEDSPNDADRKPHSVTPICTVDRNVFGSRAICATRLPPGILLFHLVDLRSAQADQRQFGAGEHGTEQQENENQKDVQTKRHDSNLKQRHVKTARRNGSGSRLFPENRQKLSTSTLPVSSW